MRQRTDPDTPPDKRQISLARKVLGELMESIARGGLYQNKLRRTFADGTVVIAQFDGTTPMVMVIAPQPAAPAVSVVLIDLWIPHGFVWVPGDARSALGWGVPAVLDAHDASPFAPKNIDPGTGVNRWTAGGPCAQVLLTNDDTTDYPRASKRRIPLAFDAKEWRTGAYTAPAGSKWHAVRLRFNDFALPPAWMGARRALWESLQQAFPKPVALPFAGYYDDAQLVADLTVGYGSDAASWPLHYNTDVEIENADGIPKRYAAAVTNEGQKELVKLLGTVPDGCPLLDTGVQSGIQTASLRTQTDWIAAGNIFWHPTDAALPTLSWDGYPALNLPEWLVLGGWVGDAGGDIFPLEGWNYEWRQSQTRYLFSRALYAMGRQIGTLPATVISAAIQTRKEPDVHRNVHVIDQVRVITWDPAKQPKDANSINYLWTFDVWFVENERFAGVPLRFTDMPIGAYDRTSNPTGWQFSGSFTVDDGPPLPPNYPITLWQMWRFNGTGDRAVAISGRSPWWYEWGPLDILEVVFGDVKANDLAWSRGTTTYDDASVAVDYADDGSLRYVSAVSSSVDAQPPNGGGPDAVLEAYQWSAGGAIEVTAWSGNPGVVVADRWVLDARDGAMAFTDHWVVCGDPESIGHPMYQVRLCRGGARIATDVFADSANVHEAHWSSVNYIDRLKASYVRDRHGDWVFGYDFGVTQGATSVYDAPIVCGNAYPSPVGASASAWLYSHWMSSVGSPVDLSGLGGAAMQAFPLGVV